MTSPQVDYTTFTPEQRKEYETSRKYVGFGKGALAGVAVGLGLNLLARSRFPVVYQSTAFKAAIVTIPVAGLSRVGADHELSHAIYRERGVYEKMQESEIDYSKLSTVDKLKTFGTQHRLGLAIGAWLGSLGGSGYLVWRDKLMTPAQKIVQARMYAQGFTLAMIIIAAIGSFSGFNGPHYIPDPNDKQHHHLIKNPNDKSHSEVDDHWKTVLEDEGINIENKASGK
ncbi:hypothetical protein V1512DRAFT_259243 [Lipomyces arxii]|uniref:uncharacterized protein n=1 Tax=Lipomyces arxii TaxID=56418 RepID=UPI0034CE034E